MRSAAARAELPPICQIHNKTFIRFGNARRWSMGCPVCVTVIREHVRAEREAQRGFNSFRRKCGPDDTGKRRPG